MVNCIDNEKLLKNIITQFCDQNFKFTLNLKILGSIHVQVDNNEVLTCLLDEKFFKSAQNRSLITTNQNLFNPLSVVKPLSENNTALNLVTTLNQLQQQQQQLKLVNPSHLVPSVKTPSLSSSSSTSSKSSTSSASSFMSGDLKQHKRKRSNGQKSDDGSSASSVSCRSSRRENQNTDEEDEDEGNSSDHNENNEHENDNENEILNNSSANQTPVKRNKRDDGVETHDEAAAAAASALSLISAAAVASKLYNQQNLQNNQQAPQHNFHSITSHLNPYQSYQSNNNENEQPSSSSLPSSSSSVPVQTQKPLKPKTKYLMNDYEQQLKQQIFQQSIENTAQNFTQSQQYTNNSYNQIENDKKMDANEQEDHDSSLEESQLYMDEDNLNKNDKENEEQKPQISQIIQQENHSSISHLQQQQNLMMAAAAAALMNNNSVNQQVNGTDNSNLKLFMPHSLALNLAAVKQQQQQQQQQIQQLQNGEKAGKKKCKNGTGSNLMSPSSSNLVPANGPNSNKSTTSTTSCSSLSSNGSSTKQGKKSRQTIAALAAAAAAAARPNTTTQANPLTPANQNVKIATMVNQFGLKENSNIDQIINEVTEKSKISVLTPKPNASKHLKKQHLLSASIQNSPISPSSTNIKKEKVKKIKPNGHFTDSSNIMTQNIVTNNIIPQNNPVILPNSVQVPSQQTNPTQAAVAAAAVALQYHQFLNNNLNKNNSANNATPQKPNPKFHLANGGYVEEAENQMRAPVKYEDADEEEPCEDDEKETGHLNGPLSIKSLTGPLTQSNTNSQGPNSGPGGNLEFECTACEKKFKYYCYYKRHMDACHSDMPKYVCEICHKSYKWEASFRQHLRTHHNIIQAENENDKNLDGKNEEDIEENNENRRMNESADEMKENGHHEDEDDEEEPDVESNERIHPSEHRNLYYERDHEQIGAAGTLASIAESLNGMHGRLMINNHNMS